jgi:hypothetical protein
MGAFRIYPCIGQQLYSAPFLTETRKLIVSLKDLDLASGFMLCFGDV